VKGVVNVASSDRMFVIQCVHMLRNQSFTKPWDKDQKRENRMIFIGRGMQQRRKELTEGFMACIAKPLRFNVGDKVLANTEDGYVEAKILRQWDEFNAYRIEVLSDGCNVHAPMDDDRFVMELPPTLKPKGYK